MQPHNRAFHIEQPPVQPIPFPQVDGRHASPSSTVIASVVGFDGLEPEVPDALLAVLAKAVVDDEVAVFVLGLEVRGGLLGGPCVDVAGQEGGAVPAAEGTGTFGFIVEGCADGDDALDLSGGGIRCAVYARGRRKPLLEIVRTLSGASRAILTVIHPPWLVPRTEAFFTPNASMTCRFMMAVSQYVKFSDLVRVWP